MSTTIVHLVRHGEVHNPDQILYGRLPGYNLSVRGRSQATRAALAFEGHDVTYLVASPLLRAQQTSEPFAEITGLEVVTDETVIESGNLFEGLRTKGWRSQLVNPKYWKHMTDPSIPSWGEPYEEILARMLGAIERAAVAAEGHEAIIISHQLPIVMVQRYLAGLKLPHNPMKRQCDLASVTSVIFRDGEIIDYTYSEPAKEI